ncbi:MAG: hypothetical protein ACLFP2_01080 [Candidatus Woesearchaeota archaeon]
MKRQGQITIFIVVGIVILLSALVIMYLNNKQATEPTSSETEYTVDMQPLISIVDNCASKLGRKGLEKLGAQGGYIYPQDYGINEHPFSYEGNGVRFSENSDLIVPYWYYLEGNDCEGGCQFEIGIPPLERDTGTEYDISIEAQLDRYVENNLPACVDFTSFESMGYEVIEKALPEVRTDVLQEEVLLDVSWPLEVHKEGTDSVTNIREFSVLLPVNFKVIYENAEYLLYQIVSENVLERYTINLLSVYSRTDPDAIPPMYDFTIDPGSTLFWLKSKIKDKVKDILTSNIQGLQYMESRNYEFRYSPDRFEEYFYNQAMTLPSLDQPGVSDLEVTFDYLPQFWDLYFDLNCGGEVCQPDSFSFFGLFSFGLQDYQFLYDVSYPVLTRLKLPDAFNGEGYTFQYFTEVNVRDNSVPDNESMTLNVTSETSMFCDPDKKFAGPIHVNVTDMRGDPLEEATVIYSCGEDSCVMGETNESGELDMEFPACYGGQIFATKQDYIAENMSLSARLDKEENVSLVMYEEKIMNITLKKKRIIPVSNGGEYQWEFKPYEVTLKDSEYAMILAEKDGRQEVGMYDNGTIQMKFAAGEYDIKIYLFDDEDFLIPEYEECHDTGWFDEQCFTVPKMEFNDSVPVGGADYTYEFSIDDIYNHSSLTFYAVSPDIYLVPETARKVGVVEQMGRTKEYSRMFEDELYPVAKD